MSRQNERSPTLFVITEKPDESARWLGSMRGFMDVVVSASVAGAWQFLQGDRVCAVVVHLIAPVSHAPRVAATLKGRRELRGVPIYVLMPDGALDHPMGCTDDIHLLEESRAEADLPVLLHRTTREQSGVRRALRSVPPQRPSQRPGSGVLQKVRPDSVPPSFGSGRR